MATCLDQHLCYFQVNILHKINQNCMRHMLIARDISLLETYYMLHTGVTGLQLLKYVVIRRIVKTIQILGITDSRQYFHSGVLLPVTYSTIKSKYLLVSTFDADLPRKILSALYFV